MSRGGIVASGRPHAEPSLIALAIAAIALATVATPASAAATRAEYVAQVDQVCMDTTPQFRTIRRFLEKAFAQAPSAFPGEPGAETMTDKQFKRAIRRSGNRVVRGLAWFDRVFGGMVER